MLGFMAVAPELAADGYRPQKKGLRGQAEQNTTVRRQVAQQLEHFYQSKNPNFDFRVRDLAPFKNDFDFNFGDRSPVEDIQNIDAFVFRIGFRYPWRQ